MVKSGKTLTEIAKTEGCTEGYVRRLIPLAVLSPKLQEAILAGLQPADLSLASILRADIPLRFEGQDRMFGLAA